MTFKDLQDEVKRRTIRDEGGTQFDTAIKNVINFSLFRIAREAPWRPLRRKSSFDTKSSYTEGSGAGAFTDESASITITGAKFLTDGVEIGRRIKLSGDGVYHTIKTITGETTLTIERAYSGTTTTTGTYKILGQEEYNLPIQSSHRLFLWHEEDGLPTYLSYIPDQEFYKSGYYTTDESTPTAYRMWGEDMVREQLRAASVISIESSSASDVNVDITVFGIVSGYPDYEVITTNASDGTTAVNGTKSFSSVERVVKGSVTVGRITATGNSGNTTVAVLPVGDTTEGIVYRKIQLYPLPDGAYPIYVQYYKDPYRLVNDTDVHELGKDFDEAIILLSTQKMKSEQNQSEGAEFAAFYLDEIRSLKKTNTEKIDWLPKLQSSRNSSFSGPHPFLRDSQIGSHFGPSIRY